jgi:membrane protease YdiL (CAAX protease family)
MNALVIGGIAFVLTAAWVELARLWRQSAHWSGEPLRPHWTLAHVALVALATVLIQLLGAHFAPIAVQDITQVLSWSTLFFAASVALVLRVAMRLSPRGLAELGFAPGGNLRGCVLAFVAYIACAPLLLGLTAVWVWFLQWSGIGPGDRDLEELLSKLAPGHRLVPVVLGALVMPAFEEILFRGFLQPALVARIGRTLGILATSLLFAAPHGVGSLLPIFALACMLGVVRERSGRLLPCIVLHALHNGLQFYFMYLASDVFQLDPRSGLLP